MNRFSRVFLSPWFWFAVVCFCLSALIWWAGPWVRMADMTPFKSWWARLLLMLGLWLGYGATWVLRGRKGKGAPALQVPVVDVEDTQDMLNLEHGFSEALSLLKTVRTKADVSSMMGRFLARFDRQAGFYRFPWFLALGVQGSGKTAALKNSGFKFRLGDAAKHEFNPTQNCQWMFADEAVFLDLAGRYTSQERNRLKDAADWRHFLKLLKRSRTRQPINGVVLTVPADVLLKSAHADLMNHANAIRQRLYELQQELSLEVPVYFLITKCDLVAGFNEFFDSLSLEERQQVWGLTLDLPSDGKTPVNLSPFVSKIDDLCGAIQTLLLDKLQKETDANRRSLMGFFPQSLRALQQALVVFTEAAFNQNPYQPRVLLRGVYFTSAAQHGEGVDPLRAALPTEYGLASSTSLFPPQTVLRTYFLGRLFSNLILGEAHLASRSVSWSRQQTLLRYLSFLALFVGGLVSCFALGAAYYQNQDYVEMVDRRLLEAKQTVEQTHITSEKDIVDVLPALDRTFALVNLPEDLFTNWWGMGQRARLVSSGKETYLRMLDDSLLAYLNTHMEQSLKTTYRKDPDMLYETLRVYLMLHDPSHFDAASVATWAKDNWPSTLGAEQRERLDCHLQRLLAAKSTEDLNTSPALSCADALALNNTPMKFKQHRLQEDLVQEVRSLVSKDSLPQRVYGRIKRLNVASNIAPFRVIDVVGPSASLVFTRVSQKSLGDGVKSLYTAEGYEKAFLPALGAVLKELQSEEVWVLNKTDAVWNADASRIALEMSESFQLNKEAVKKLYLEDYAKTWENFLNDFRIVPSDSVQGSLRVLRYLLSADSPLMSFLNGVSEQTSLVRLAEDKEQKEGVVEQLKNSAENRVSSLSRAGAKGETGLKGVPEGVVESIVDNRFSAIHRLVKAPESGGVAAIDATFVLLKELYAYLSLAEEALKSKDTLPKSDVPVRMKSEGRMLPTPLNEMLQGLSDLSLKNVYSEEGKNLSALMGAFTAECKQAIESRYPFDLSSNTEVKRDDFQHFFAPNGLIDRFFRKNLEPLVDVSTKPWSFKSGFDVDSRRVVRTSDLDEFQRADTIRQVFFSPSSDTPMVRFSIKPVDMDRELMQSVLEIDGQVLRYRHDAVVPVQMTWPNNTKGGGGVIRLMLTSLKGEDAGSLTYGGDWALWRAIEQKVEKTARPETVRVTFKVREHSVTYEITATTSRNPFLMTELDAFHCPTKIN